MRAATLPMATQQNSTTRNAPTQDTDTAHRGDDQAQQERTQHPKRATPNSQNSRHRPDPTSPTAPPKPAPPDSVAAAAGGAAGDFAARCARACAGRCGRWSPTRPPTPERSQPSRVYFFFLERTAPPTCGGRPSQKKGKSQNPPHRDKTERNGSQQPDQAQRPTKPENGGQAAQERPNPPDPDKPPRKPPEASKQKRTKAKRNPQAQRKSIFLPPVAAVRSFLRHPAPNGFQWGRGPIPRVGIQIHSSCAPRLVVATQAFFFVTQPAHGAPPAVS